MKTKHLLTLTVSTLTSLMLSSCVTSSQIKQAVEKDPSIVFVAIEKDPAKFIEVVNKAAQDAQRVAGEKAQEEEQQAREEEFKNPLKPVIEPDRVIFGKKNAPITIVEYSDFQCPYCGRGYKTVKQIRKAYGDKVRIVFKHLPLEFHPMAMPAARYFEAIAKQSHEKAEKFHDKMFENQGMLKEKGTQFLRSTAKKLGVNMKKLDDDLKNNPDIDKRIATDTFEAKNFGINGTPGFIINGVSLRGAYPFESFKEIIDEHLSSMK